MPQVRPTEGLTLSASSGQALGRPASGMTEAQILANFPDLTETEIRACLAFASSRECQLHNPAR